MRSISRFLTLSLFTLIPLSILSADPLLLFDFEDPDPTAAWHGHTGTIVAGHRGGHALQVSNPDPAKSTTCWTPVPADQIDGQLVTITASVKADNVSNPPKHWNGIKVMLVVETDGDKVHPQIHLGRGSFSWTKATEVLRLPKGITKAQLVLGLEQASGKVCFDNITIRIGRPDLRGKRAATKFKGHDLARLRGVMIGPEYEAGDIRHLVEEWQANHVRWQLNWTPMKRAEEWARDLDAYDKWLDGALVHMDKALDDFDRTGVRVLVDLHCPPGGRAEGGVCRMFQEERYRVKLLTAWDRIAKRIKDRKCVYACDLINEPVEPKTGAITTWPELATQATDVIRAVIPDMPVVYEPGPWGTANGFDSIAPLDRKRVIYSFHMYQPHQFTHQTLHDERTFTYPGMIKGVSWDKAQLEHAMAAAIEFQQAYNVHIYVGEFSAIRWAPDNSAHRYLSDCIDLFEAHDWDWAYHAYREFHGWSVEHGTDRKNTSPASKQTDRERLLRQWFAKNHQPQ